MTQTPEPAEILQRDYGPTLDEFLAAYGADDNEWWRSSSGQHQNWFEDAVDRWRAAESDRDTAWAEVDTLRADEQRLRAIVTDLAKAAEEVLTTLGSTPESFHARALGQLRVAVKDAHGATTSQERNDAD